METDPTQLPTTETIPQDINSMEIFSHSENLINASEALRADIEGMNDSSVELMEHVMADPLSERVMAQGVSLGLSEEEVSAVMKSSAYIEEDVALRNKAQTLYGAFCARLVQAAHIGLSALAIGTSAPTFAESHGVLPQEALTITQSLEEEKIPRTHEEAYARLRESILAPTEHVGVFVHKEDSTSFTPEVFRSGSSNAVGLGDKGDEELKKAMESNTSDIEVAHTHPINEGTGSTYLDKKDEDILHHGGIPHIAMPPSSTDLMGLLDDNIYKYPPAQFSGRVIDPSGEWEYGISDSAAPFIVEMHESLDEIEEKDGKMIFSEDERAYLKKIGLDDEDLHPILLLNKLSSINATDPLAVSIQQKVKAVISFVNKTIGKNVNAADMEKFNSLEGGISPWLHPGTPEGDAEIARRERIASELGFRLKYTPNTIATKTEHVDTGSGTIFQMSKTINPDDPKSLRNKIPIVGKDESSFVTVIEDIPAASLENEEGK